MEFVGVYYEVKNWNLLGC